MSSELADKLEKIGYNRDVEITGAEWEEERERQHESRLALATLLPRQERTYRDGNARRSVELKDYRQLDSRADFVAELERFNPGHHPLRHLLIDFPAWLWKNRIKNYGPRGSG